MNPFDVFNADPFKATSLAAAVDKMDYVPGLLGSIPGLFVPEPVRSEDIWIEERTTGGFVILQTSPRGASPHQTGSDPRKARAFKTVRIADASRITASELLGVRRFGSEINLKDVQEEVARRQFKMKQNFDLTWENLRMGAILGKTVDADGSTIYDWEAEFGQTIPAELDFDLDNGSPASGAVRKKCTAVRRSILKNLKGVGVASNIIGICGDNFWDDLTSHPEVEKTYLNWAAAADLRNGHGKEWSSFRYGEIDFVNYRGTDDDTTLTVGTDKCKFFPVGAGIFKWAMAPGEAFEHVGSLGQLVYSNMVLDKDRNTWADVEMYSYPLPICTMPQALHRGRRT